MSEFHGCNFLFKFHVTETEVVYFWYSTLPLCELYQLVSPLSHHKLGSLVCCFLQEKVCTDLVYKYANSTLDALG